MIYIAIIGLGLIGKRVLSDIEKLNGFKVIGTCNSKIGYIDKKIVSTNDFINIIIDKYKENLVIIDCTSSLEIAEKYIEWLSIGIKIVTPNKKAFSSKFSLWESVNNKNCFYESTVGAGLPIISTIKDMILTGDEIIKIEGIFSGTLSYIFNKFSKSNDKFSDIVKEAKKLGYTEPDPRDDLNGMDVCRKLVILARTIGLNISMEDVEIYNIIPEELRNINLDEFMDKLQEHDDYFEKYRGLKYIGKINNKCKIEMTKDHLFDDVEGNDNIIVIYSERFKKQPLIIRGPGAGEHVTSFGILCDLMKIN